MASSIPRPWEGKRWEKEAQAANDGMEGQGYIVHVVMKASDLATVIGGTYLFLTVVQIVVAICRK